MNTNTRMADTSPRRSDPNDADRLSLYDRYAAMAYGIILHIVPQPEVAQDILVELFAALPTDVEQSGSERVSSTIIRMARAKALAARPNSTDRSTTSFHPTERNLPKVVFNLSFWYGCQPDEIAERLEISTADVMKAIRIYVKSFTIA